MNGRRLIVLLGLLGVLIGSSPLAAAAAGGLPAEVRTGSNTEAAKQAAQTFVQAEIQKLTDEDPSVQSQAREAIITEAVSGQGGKPSDTFLNAYSDVLANDLKPLANHKDPRVRLNVAIIVARVAQAGNSPHLAPLVIDLLDDPSEAVVLWGVKAAKYVLPAVLGNAVAANNVPLMPAFLKAVQKYSKSAAVIQSAYESLKFDSTSVAPATWKAVLQSSIDAMQSILKMRIEQYTNGIPAFPTIDPIATSYMVDKKVWHDQSPAQQVQAVQETLDLMSVIAKRWSDAELSRKGDLADTYNKASAALWVVGSMVGSDKIQAVTGNNAKVLASNTPTDVQQKAEAARAAAKSVPEFAQLKEPPAVSAMTSGTEATTQPATTAPATH